MSKSDFVQELTAIKTLLRLQSHEKFAKLFISNCKTNIKVLSTKDIYIYNTDLKYYQKVQATGKLMVLVSEVLHPILNNYLFMFEKYLKKLKNQKKQCDDDKMAQIMEQIVETKNFVKKAEQAIINIETTHYIEKIIVTIINLLTLTPEQQANLNRLDNYINFRNCKLDLRTLEYSDRDENDFVTEFLDYDFMPKADKKIKEEIKQILKQICNNNDEDYNFIMSYLGYCITSETKEQKYLNVVGPSASNGKSTLIKFMEAVFNIYTFKSDKRLFSESFGKSHKYFSGMKNKRIVYIEELDKKKIDGDLLKDTVDGNKMSNEVLFGTTEDIQIKFKLLFFSNNLMNFDSDQGIKRRTISVFFNSKFVDEEDYEKEKGNYKGGNVYKKNKTLLDKFNNDDYKNAFVHLIIAQSKKYFENGITIPESYKKTTDDLCDENDKMKNFLDNHFDITKNEDDRITKDEFKTMFNQYTGCNHAWTSILSDVKRVGLDYDKSKRAVYNGMSLRGVVIGIKKKTQELEDDAGFVDNDGLDYGIDTNTSEFEKLRRENEEIKRERDEYKHQLDDMRKELEELKAMMKQQTQPTKSFLSQVLEVAEEAVMKKDSDSVKKLNSKCV